MLEAGFSLRRSDVAAALDRVLAAGGVGVLPRSITVDHGTEFTSRALEHWVYTRGVALDATRPGTPTDNGHIQSFNGRLHDECLNTHWFLSLTDARRTIEAWRVAYHTARPHRALGRRTPAAYAAQLAADHTTELSAQKRT